MITSNIRHSISDYAEFSRKMTPQNRQFCTRKPLICTPHTRIFTITPAICTIPNCIFKGRVCKKSQPTNQPCNTINFPALTIPVLQSENSSPPVRGFQSAGQRTPVLQSAKFYSTARDFSLPSQRNFAPRQKKTSFPVREKKCRRPRLFTGHHPIHAKMPGFMQNYSGQCNVCR